MSQIISGQVSGTGRDLNHRSFEVRAESCTTLHSRPDDRQVAQHNAPSSQHTCATVMELYCMKELPLKRRSSNPRYY